MYGVLMRVRVKPEKREEFIDIVTGLQARVKAGEEFTYVYEILQGDDPLEFVFFECFESEEAYERHANMDYHLAIAEAGYACLSEDPKQEFLAGVERP